MEARSEKLLKILNQPLKFFLTWGNIIILFLFLTLLFISEHIYIPNNYLFEGSVIESSRLPDSSMNIKVILFKGELAGNEINQIVFLKINKSNANIHVATIKFIDKEAKRITFIINSNEKNLALLDSEVSFKIKGKTLSLFSYLFSDKP